MCDGSLTITDNAALPTLTGMGSLRTVGGYLAVFENPALISIDELAALAVVDGDLYACDNPVLPTCQAEALASRLDHLGGEPNISGNDDSGSCE